jgi:hypothetical protein
MGDCSDGRRNEGHVLNLVDLSDKRGTRGQRLHHVVQPIDLQQGFPAPSAPGIARAAKVDTSASNSGNPRLPATKPARSPMARKSRGHQRWPVQPSLTRLGC